MELNSKKEWQDLFLQIINPLKPHYSKNCAHLALGQTGALYPESIIGMEAFSRPLWGLAPFWAGGGTEEDFSEIYRLGLVAGTDPENEEYWGSCTDYDQRFVEMAALACAMLNAPQEVWNPLSTEERQNIAAWLGMINNHDLPECNWQMFRVLVNIALKKHDMPYSQEMLELSLAKIESYYLGDGWYQDGGSPQKDYYISFAIHYYCLVYAKIMEAEDSLRCATFKERGKRFAQDFIYWFAENGEAIPFGRSLTYRFAQSSFWAACIGSGIEPFSLGVMKGILVRNVQWWMNQSIFDRDGILTIGYAYPNLIMAEHYNAPGSPYWALKTFGILGLEEEHPFWTAEIESLPRLDLLKPLPRADMLLQVRDQDTIAYAAGVCRRYGGHGHFAEKYSKFTYSTAFGISMARSNVSLSEASPDCMLAFVIDENVFVRKISQRWEIKADGVMSQWSPFTGIKVVTTIIPTREGHIREHTIESEWDCIAVDYGYAVPRFSQAGYEEGVTQEAAWVSTDKLCCGVSGIGLEATPEILRADPNTNLLYPNTAIPGVRYKINKGISLLKTVVEAKVKG